MRKFQKIMTTGLGIAILSIPFATAHAQSETLDIAIENALQQSKVQDFDTALYFLETVSDRDKKSYNYRLTKARVLTWAGRHSEAESNYAELLQEFPGNPDVMVSYGYLQFFRGNLQSAESYFNQVLAVHPTYLDAYEGLQRTYDLRKDSKEVAYSSLNDAVSCPEGYGLASDGACYPVSAN